MPTGDAQTFVVQRHRARRLHYDLRLEEDGVLRSWAVPKGVPLDPGARHLAVHVEDHPLDYASFEGVIPAGQYGAGTVEVWDRGTYDVVERKRDGGLTFDLQGTRLRGRWTLVPARLDGKEQNWLLLRKDAGPDRPHHQPMLATAASSPPTGAGWLFEPKWDGFRAQAVVRGGDPSLTGRGGSDLGARFPDLLRALPLVLRTPDAVVDAELCALDETGRSSFESLQRGEGAIVLVAFDLLELDGVPLIDLPLVERRARLAAVVDPGAGPVVLSPAFDDGAALLQAARERGLEGIVAKREDSPYRPGRRSRDWLKVKTARRARLTVVGWSPGAGRHSSSVGALHLATSTEHGLRYAGSVGSGLSDDERERLRGQLRRLERPSAPLGELPRLTRSDRERIRWVEPVLEADVAFTEWTRAGRLRQPVLHGLVEPSRGPAAPRPSTGSARTPLLRVEHAPFPAELRRGRRVLRFSNLEKPFWPEEGITKGDLLAYYRDVAPVLIPHLRRRPFTMKRYPDGWQGKHFFQKQAPAHMPSWIRTAALPASRRSGETRVIEYPVLDDELALLWAVSMGCIDLHAGAARVDRPDRPDWVVLDLDPAEGTPFDVVVEVALLVRDVLGAVGLSGLPKTSGSRGIHVLVPIARRHTHADARSFAEIVAGALARSHPSLVTTEWTRAKRHGVLLDVNQNGAGRTTAMAYSVRPRPGAPVSTPLEWDELRSDLDPSLFTREVVLRRIADRGDLLAGALEGGQSLAAALRAVR